MLLLLSYFCFGIFFFSTAYVFRSSFRKELHDGPTGFISALIILFWPITIAYFILEFFTTNFLKGLDAVVQHIENKKRSTEKRPPW